MSEGSSRSNVIVLCTPPDRPPSSVREKKIWGAAGAMSRLCYAPPQQNTFKRRSKTFEFNARRARFNSLFIQLRVLGPLPQITGSETPHDGPEDTIETVPFIDGKDNDDKELEIQIVTGCATGISCLRGSFGGVLSITTFLIVLNDS